ncbi:MAG: hypothetical protein GYA21_16660 [Myxococcales bacterium]|nr:hypothetical protein [Myxococcales bacterium]
MLAGAPQPIRIRKYGNRRLYDTSRSRYITLEELASLVRAGNSVLVQDAKDGRDLTRAVLTQAILEEQERLDLLPTELLESIIRVQGTFQQAPFFELLRAAARQFGVAGRDLAAWFAPPAPVEVASAPAQEKPKRKRGRRSGARVEAGGGEPQTAAGADAQARLRELLRRLGG